MTTVVNGTIGGAIVGLLASIGIVALRVRLSTSTPVFLRLLLGERAPRSRTWLLATGLLYGAVGAACLSRSS